MVDCAENKEVLFWRYFLETPNSSSLLEKPVPRAQDGLYDTTVSKRMDDPYFSVGPLLYQTADLTAVSCNRLDMPPSWILFMQKGRKMSLTECGA